MSEIVPGRLNWRIKVRLVRVGGSSVYLILYRFHEVKLFVPTVKILLVVIPISVLLLNYLILRGWVL